MPGPNQRITITMSRDALEVALTCISYVSNHAANVRPRDDNSVPWTPERTTNARTEALNEMRTALKQ